MLATFLPIVLLWILAYFTLFIDIEHFSDRFVGAVTILLVLVAVKWTVNEDLPKTSYFKFIDLWFLWYISTILFITLFHIYINHIPNNRIGHTNQMMFRNGEQLNNVSLRSKVNKSAIVLFAVTTVLFNTFYFILLS